MNNTPSTQSEITAANLVVKSAQEKLDEKRGVNRTRVASEAGKPQARKETALPTTSASDAVLAAIMAKLEKLESESAKKDELIAKLQSGKATAKAEKVQPAPENESISVKGNIMTITVDLSKDTGKDIASKARRIVASSGTFGFYNLTHNGVRFSLSCQVYHDNPNFEALDKAYKAEKRANKK